MKTLNLAIVMLVSLLVVVQMVLWWPHLPDIMPSHFDSDGNVNGEMAKSGFYFLIAVLQFLMLPGFVLLAMVLAKLPDSAINLPNKDYWLAPERRQETLEVSKGVLIFCGWLTALLLMASFHLTAMVAIKERATISPEFTWMMVAYLVGIFGICFWMFIRFRKPTGLADLRAETDSQAG